MYREKNYKGGVGEWGGTHRKTTGQGLPLWVDLSIKAKWGVVAVQGLSGGELGFRVEGHPIDV